jgi:hypothetical protein
LVRLFLLWRVGGYLEVVLVLVRGLVVLGPGRTDED